MYKLYGTKGTGTSAVKAALAEAGAPFEDVEVTTREKQHLTADYQMINPRQQVPALMLPDGSIMTETAAMLLHIADAHPAARLAPPPGTPARAQHDRWLVFLAVNVYEGELRKMYGERYTADGEGREGVGAAARAYVDRHYALVEQALGDGPYFFGDDLSMVDIYLWTFANWHDTAWVEANCPKIVRLVQTVQARPKIAPIQAENYGP
jgi:glutathione S-transferase